MALRVRVAAAGLVGLAMVLSGLLVFAHSRFSFGVFEVVENSVVAIDLPRAVHEPLRTIGPVVFVGEIVDSRCYMGVMKPDEGPAHRDCAVRCLLCEVPLVLVLHESNGDLRRVPLVGPGGVAFSEALQFLLESPYPFAVCCSRAANSDLLQRPLPTSAS